MSRSSQITATSSREVVPSFNKVITSQKVSDCMDNYKYSQHGGHYNLGRIGDSSGHGSASKFMKNSIQLSSTNSSLTNEKRENTALYPIAPKLHFRAQPTSGTYHTIVEQRVSENNAPVHYEYVNPAVTRANVNVNSCESSSTVISNTASFTVSPVTRSDYRDANVNIRGYHSSLSNSNVSYGYSYPVISDSSSQDKQVIIGHKRSLHGVPIDMNRRHWIDDKSREDSTDNHQQGRLQILNIKQSDSSFVSKSMQESSPNTETSFERQRFTGVKVTNFEKIKHEHAASINQEAGSIIHHVHPRGVEVESTLHQAPQMDVKVIPESLSSSNCHSEFRGSELDAAPKGKCAAYSNSNATTIPMNRNSPNNSEKKSATESIRSESNPNPSWEGEPVFINLYDMWTGNNFVRSCGCAMYHSGVEVYGLEVAYGGRDSDRSGVYLTNPREGCDQPYAQTLEVGRTEKTWNKVISLLMDIKDLYRANEYDILWWNCHDFTQELVKILIPGWTAPKWLNRLASVGQVLDTCIPTCCHCWPGSYAIESVDEGSMHVLGEQEVMKSKHSIHKYSNPKLGSSKYLPVNYISKRQRWKEERTGRQGPRKQKANSDNKVIISTTSNRSGNSHYRSRSRSSNFSRVVV